MKPPALDAVNCGIYDAVVKEHAEFLDNLCLAIPESWDDDRSAESIVVSYVRTLEQRVQALGGSLERFPEDADPITAVTEAEWQEDPTTAPDPAHLLFVQPPYMSAAALDAPYVTIGVTRTFRKFMSVQTARDLAIALIRAARFAERCWEDARRARAKADARAVASTNAIEVPPVDIMSMTSMGPVRIFKGRADD